MSKKASSKSSSSSKASAEAANGDSPSLYQKFLEVREAVLRHKWLKSEEAGEDIGFEPALTDWMENQAPAEGAKADAKESAER